MFITADILRKYKACEQDIKYIERFYPNGAEMIDIIRDRHINKDFLHWGRKTFTTSEEEFFAYCQACKIVNSENFWNCQEISNSKNIIQSRCIESSKGVFNSEDIRHSTDICDSSFVQNSHQVFVSSIINNSEKTYKGENINDSNNICLSQMISDSKNIFRSSNIFNSTEIINCTNMTNAHFCQNCSNVRNSLFCNNLNDAEYCVFNLPVDEKRFNLFLSQYDQYFQTQLIFSENWPKDIIDSTAPQITYRIDIQHSALSKQFLRWAKTLPGYDKFFMYKLTMLPEILVD